MPYTSKKRKREFPNLWQREEKDPYVPEGDEVYCGQGLERRRFIHYNGQLDFDIYMKRAALRASPSVVSLISYSGDEDKEVFQATGTIIESDDNSSIILTSATLILQPKENGSILENLKIVVHLSDGKAFEGQLAAHDFHYNIAAVKICTGASLPAAYLAHLDDSITVDLCERHTSNVLQRHSSSTDLVPGGKVIALGRWFSKPYDLMAAPGKFSMDHCEYDCKELLRAECVITRTGTGGPIVNLGGDIIGIVFYAFDHAPFMPINVASKWWKHYKKYGEYRRPWVGMGVANLYVADLDMLEKIIQKFPNVFKGVIVEEVTNGSSADSAGICPNDVIVECDGKRIEGALQFFDVMWDKTGDQVELVVLRESDGSRMLCKIMVEKTSPHHFYRWPVLKTEY